MPQSFRERFEQVVAAMATAAGLEASQGGRADATSETYLHLPRRLDCCVRVVATFHTESFVALVALPGDVVAIGDVAVLRGGMRLEDRAYRAGVCDEAAGDRVLAAVAKAIAGVTAAMPSDGELREALHGLMLRDRRAATDAVMATVTGAATRALLAANLRDASA